MRQKNKPETKALTDQERLQKCGQQIQQALAENGCDLFAALKVGTAESPILDICGFPIVIKVALLPQA